MIRLRADELAAKCDEAAKEFRAESVRAAIANDEIACARGAGQAGAAARCAEAIRHYLTETPDESRQRFEAWIRSRYPTTADVLLEIRDGEYWHSFTNAAHMGWTMAGAFIQHSEEKS